MAFSPHVIFLLLIPFNVNKTANHYKQNNISLYFIEYLITATDFGKEQISNPWLLYCKSYLFMGSSNSIGAFGLPGGGIKSFMGELS